MKYFKNKTDDFFRWVKGTELVELDDIDVSEDPVLFTNSKHSKKLLLAILSP